MPKLVNYSYKNSKVSLNFGGFFGIETSEIMTGMYKVSRGNVLPFAERSITREHKIIYRKIQRE